VSARGGRLAAADAAQPPAWTTRGPMVILARVPLVGLHVLTMFATPWGRPWAAAGNRRPRRSGPSSPPNPTLLTQDAGLQPDIAQMLGMDDVLCKRPC